jgi:S1-C subfamily serine protease
MVFSFARLSECNRFGHPQRLSRCRRSSWCAVTAALILSALLSGSAWAADTVRDSVVKIHSELRGPSYGQPWTKSSPKKVSGSGVIISGERILTNAHVVLYSSRVLIQANETTERIEAEVEAIAPGLDLALLTVKDKSLFENRPPLEFAEALPSVKDTVNAYGFPVGGKQMSVTEGIVSRIEFAAYSFGEQGLRIQVDAALNPGNSGGPAIADGKIVGLVFSNIPSVENTGYLIPVEEIRMFLNDVADGTYDGKPKMMDFLQTVEHDSLRAKLQLGSDVGGLMVARPYLKDEDYPLKEWDVITHVGEHALDNQGAVEVQDSLRLSFHYLIPKLAVDDQVPLTIIRNGEPISVQLPLLRKPNLLIPFLMGSYPPHFIHGPMVFTTASQELVDVLERSFRGPLVARRSPLLNSRFAQPSSPGEELVILGPAMFTSPITEGYDNQVFGVVERVNDVKIKSLAHLVETIRDAEGEYITFYIAGNYETMVFDRQELMDSTEQILDDEGIRYQMSKELQEIWDAKP